MPLITDYRQVKEIYDGAADSGIALPVFCAEDRETLEAILASAREVGDRIGVEDLPIIPAWTSRYPPRGQMKLLTACGDVLLAQGGQDAVRSPGALQPVGGGSLPGGVGVGGDVEAVDGQQVGQPGVEVVVSRRALGDDGDEIAGLLPQEQAVEFALSHPLHKLSHLSKAHARGSHALCQLIPYKPGRVFHLARSWSNI